MHPFKESFAELISLTKIFLFREHVVEPPERKIVPAPSLSPPEPILMPIKNIETKEKPVNLTSSPEPSKPSVSLQSTLTQNLKGMKTELEPIAKNFSETLTEMRSLCKEVFPRMIFHESPPSDSLAKEKGNAWKSLEVQKYVLILTFQSTAAEMEFLQKVAGAIQSRFLPTKIIDVSECEESSTWETLLDRSITLVLVPELLLARHPRLKRYYKQEQGKHLLNGIPTLFLSSLPAYENDKKLKASLWQSLCSALTS